MNNKGIAMKVENISKCYRIGLKENIHDTVTRSILEFIKSPLKNYRKYRSLYKFDDIFNFHCDAFVVHCLPSTLIKYIFKSHPQ